MSPEYTSKTCRGKTCSLACRKQFMDRPNALLVQIKMKQVTIIQRISPHYRLAFYQRLYESLSYAGISFTLIYGQEETGTVPKTVTIKEPWAIYCPNVYYHCFNQEFVWQKIPPQYLKTDLLIIEQANRLLNNYSFLFNKRSSRRVAFWGHGKNMQAGRRSFKEFIKKRLVNKVNWWFAYTEISKESVLKSGFPAERITTVNNSIDTVKLQENLAKVTQQQIDAIYSYYNISAPHLTCLYCGGLYPDKKLDFLIAAGEKIHKTLPGFSLIVVGDGPEAHKINEASLKFPWLHSAGPRFGNELATYLRCANAMLMPGLVGLVIIDCFLAKVPLFTTMNNIHSPEIAYLNHGENGIMTPYNTDDYSKAVLSFFQHHSKKLRDGCLKSGQKYSLDNMVTNFATGIEQCLDIEC